MDDTQHASRTMKESSAPRAEESHGSETAASTVARMLANPRRIRRN
ncbi:MAG: hypothetical protein JWQ99_985 [Blastococcus sp.]|jgi:hypothetical protein|nr:hypothetical protein [Blastococcus sp.]